jgi:sterol desaturase/sphingolipid hydroxylase (fatty acid hydroxylase superfamily)
MPSEEFADNPVKYLEPHSYFIELFVIFSLFLLRNYFLIAFVDYGIKDKPRICNDITKYPKEEYLCEFSHNVILATLIESVTQTFLRSYFIFYDTNVGLAIIGFIPISFTFELIFDFFHYWGHRILHLRLIYPFFHKKHHKFSHPTTITTFYQDPVDLILTNSLPTIVGVFCTPYLSYPQLHVILIYKTFIEISGHSGRFSRPSCSFSQFIWLPKFFEIELYTEDHDAHHCFNDRNFGKRFSIWDKIFGTFYESKNCRQMRFSIK